MNANDFIMSMLDDIQFAYWQKRIPEKKTFDTINLSDKLFDKLVSPGNLTVLDGKYNCVSEKWWDWILEEFYGKRLKWNEEWDCDKFAIELKSFCNKLGVNSCGITLGWYTYPDGSKMYHAYNCYVNDKLEVFLIEPQQGIRQKVESKGMIEIGTGKYETSIIIL